MLVLTPWEPTIQGIMKLVNNMHSNEAIHTAIREALEDAYRQGEMYAHRNPRKPDTTGQ